MTTEKSLSEFRDKFPAGQSTKTGKWGWRRVNGCLDLLRCVFATESAAIADRDITIREGRYDSENGQPR